MSNELVSFLMAVLIAGLAMALGIHIGRSR